MHNVGKVLTMPSKRRAMLTKLPSNGWPYYGVVYVDAHDMPLSRYGESASFTREAWAQMFPDAL